MAISLPDEISTKIYLTGEWEPHITQLLRSRLLPGNTFVDVGANIGYYSIMASGIVGPNGRVISIEASTKIFERLTRNLNANKCTNVTAIHAAAADKPGALSLFLAHDTNLGQSTVVPSVATRRGFLLEDKVRADTLESLAGKAVLRNARLIKIDVEGAEKSALEPLFRSLSYFDSETEWLLEFSPQLSAGGQPDIDSIFAAFTNAGYQPYIIQRNPNTRSTSHSHLTQYKLEPLSESPTLPQCDVFMTRHPPY